MSEWSDGAMDAWADYLDGVRRELHDAADADAVVRDLEDHATHAFTGVSDQVSESQMRALIARLGSPTEIAAEVSDRSGQLDARALPAESPPAWHHRVLGFASLAALLVGVVWQQALTGLFPLSYVLARVGHHSLGATEEKARWLYYPALVAGSFAIAAVLTLWPLALVVPVVATGGLADAWMQERSIASSVDSATRWTIAWGVGFALAAVWCMVLRRFVRRKPEFLIFLLNPFATEGSAVTNAGRVLSAAAGILAATAALLFLLLLLR